MSADDNHILEQIQLISDQLMSAYEYQSVSFYSMVRNISVIQRITSLRRFAR